jgi:hypothetical protein
LAKIVLILFETENKYLEDSDRLLFVSIRHSSVLIFGLRKAYNTGLIHEFKVAKTTVIPFIKIDNGE